MILSSRANGPMAQSRTGKLVMDKIQSLEGVERTETHIATE